MLNARLAAKSRIARAIGFGWLCGGLAIAACLTSAGAACALYGYSSLISVKPAADQIAKSLGDAFKNAELKTSITGTMSLPPNSELKLAPDQKVKLSDNAIVKLDPESSVRVVGNIKIPQPSDRQLQPNVMSGDELPFTTYTIFRSVPYGAGRVETGWNFDLSDTTRPRSQYCSYIQSIAKGAQVKDIIAVNGVAREPPALVRNAFNFAGAIENCIWFSGV